MASRRQFQLIPIIMLQMRTLNYATSLALVRHAGSLTAFRLSTGPG
jgi:hypothetical protein